jgi:peptide/nickel transport system permease protein
VVPNALGAATVATTLGVGQRDPARERAVVPRPRRAAAGAELGNLIAGGRDLIVTAPWVSLVPGLLLVATVLACTRVGDAVAGGAGGPAAGG